MLGREDGEAVHFNITLDNVCIVSPFGAGEMVDMEGESKRGAFV